ncbi:MAG TPA: lasso peptide biosynthesis B2 protein [Gemmatimonadaceae bacterium]|jgi:hypothetical protein|nr:lasso peptide biosynthesis B2 protein [Gemmatimonadaceae bacterium]
MGAARAITTGVWAALRAPLWGLGSRLLTAMGTGTAERATANGSPAEGTIAALDDTMALAARVAARTLHVLALTRTFWRDGCLHQTLARYLVLRSYRKTAVVRVGVRHSRAASSSAAPIEAHAWLAFNEETQSERDSAGFRELTAPRG